MDAQEHKDELLAALDRDWEQLSGVLATVSDEDLDRLQTDYGWSLKDVVVHLAAWERESVALIDAVLQDRAIADYSDVESWNARFYEAGKNIPPAEARAELAASVDAMRQRLATMPAGDYAGRIPEWVTAPYHFAEHLDHFRRARPR